MSRATVLLTIPAAIAVTILLLIVPPPMNADEAKTGTKEFTDNQASLLAEYRGQLEFSASTYWGGWPASHAFDGDPRTSWFTARGDAAAKGTKPWIAVKFPADIPVRRVSILSNRETSWLKGFTILAARVELLDKDGKVLATKEDELGGERPDMDYRFKEPVKGVRTVRLTSLRDEGDQNGYEDVSIGEVLIE
jgi:hypothetical protein